MMRQESWPKVVVYPVAGEPDEYPFDGEILPPSFVRGAAEFHAHEAFSELAKVYGRKRACELWREIPEEHEHE